MKRHLIRHLAGVLLGATLFALGACTSMPMETASSEPPTHDYVGSAD